jgi:hypothetical protein
MRKMKRHASIAGTFLLSLVLAFAAVGVTDSVSHAAPEDDIESAFLALVEAWNNEDIHAVAGHFTDEGIADQFSGVSGDEAMEAITGDRMALGPIVDASMSNVQVTGDDATAVVEIEFEAGASLYEEWEFHLVDGSWLAGPGTTLSRPIPAGVTPVSMTLGEYAFVYDRAAVRSGNFGLEVTNVGAEEHEVLVVALGPTGTASDLVNAKLETEELPEWAELIAIEFFDPGASGTAILPQALVAGRYAFICFLPSPAGTPHALLGMVSDFTVGSGVIITSPSTGDAGLVGATNEGSNQGRALPLAAGLTIAFMLLAGLVKTKWSARSR